MFARRPRDLKLTCKTSISAMHVSCITTRHPHVQIEGLASYNKVAFGHLKFTTCLYEVNSSRKKKNCFVYSVAAELFGRVVGIYHSSISNRVFIVFEGVHTESNVRLPHAIFSCTFNDTICCETIERCEMSLMIPYKQGSAFSMSRRVNTVENS